MHDGKWRSFAEECPLLLVKLLEVMHDSNGGQKLADSSFSKEERAGEERDLSRRPPLHIRCIEFHDYKPGGALMDPGHIDVGSTLTLSVQLSHPDRPRRAAGSSRRTARAACRRHTSFSAATPFSSAQLRCTTSRR